jgi:hypothetical protein
MVTGRFAAAEGREAPSAEGVGADVAMSKTPHGSTHTKENVHLAMT